MQQASFHAVQNRFADPGAIGGDVVAGSPRRLGINAREPGRSRIQLADERVNDAVLVLRVHIVVDLGRKRLKPAEVTAFDVLLAEVVSRFVV